MLGFTGKRRKCTKRYCIEYMWTHKKASTAERSFQFSFLGLSLSTWKGIYPNSPSQLFNAMNFLKVINQNPLVFTSSSSSSSSTLCGASTSRFSRPKLIKLWLNNETKPIFKQKSQIQWRKKQLNATSEHEQINILRKGSNFKIFSTSRNQQTTQSKKEEKKNEPPPLSSPTPSSPPLHHH